MTSQRDESNGAAEAQLAVFERSFDQIWHQIADLFDYAANECGIDAALAFGSYCKQVENARRQVTPKLREALAR